MCLVWMKDPKGQVSRNFFLLAFFFVIKKYFLIFHIKRPYFIKLGKKIQWGQTKIKRTWELCNLSDYTPKTCCTPKPPGLSSPGSSQLWAAVIRSKRWGGRKGVLINVLISVKIYGKRNLRKERLISPRSSRMQFAFGGKAWRKGVWLWWHCIHSQDAESDVIILSQRALALSPKKICFYSRVRMWIPVSLCHICVNARRGQQRALDPLEMKLQVFMNRLTWVLGIELSSFARTVSILSCWAISPALFSSLNGMVSPFSLTQSRQSFTDMPRAWWF